MRQIVEVHTLMAVFRDDPPQRQRWLDASTNRVEKSFRPSQMRQTGGSCQVSTSSTANGPDTQNPSARWMLPCHSESIHPSAISADLALHLTETFDLLADFLHVIPDSEALAATPLPHTAELLEASRRWRILDQLSKRWQTPPTLSDVTHVRSLLNQPDGTDSDRFENIHE